MNRVAMGAIAEAIGVVTIFISLVYVGIQIRQNSRQLALSVEAQRLAAFERSVESGNRIRELLMVNADLAKIFTAGCRDYRQLDSSDKLRFSMLVRNIFSAIQGAYMRQVSVGHDPLGFEGQERMVDSMLSNPGVRDCLASIDVDWHPDFHRFVSEREAQFMTAPAVQE